MAIGEVPQLSSRRSKISKVTAMLLAAGESTRMGKLKQLLPFGDSTILGQVLKNLLESSLDEIIVVLGYRAEEIASRIADMPVKIVINQDFRQGMSSSIRKGLTQMPESSAIMISLGDQPLIGKEIVDRLLEEFSGGEHGIVAPAYKGRRGHPVIFDAKYQLELSRLEGDVGAKAIVEAHPEDVLQVEIDSESIVGDIDNKNDYSLQMREDL